MPKRGKRLLTVFKKLAKRRRLKPIPALTLSGGTLKHLEDAKEFRVWAYPKRGGDDYYISYPSLERAIVGQMSLADSGELPEDPIAVVWDKKHRGWREVFVPKKMVTDAENRILRTAI